MTATIAERVAAGVAFLDKRQPGWWKADSIRVSALTIEDDCCCVLGQLFGCYDEAVDDLGLSGNAHDLGFIWEVFQIDETDALTDEWKRVIAERWADA